MLKRFFIGGVQPVQHRKRQLHIARCCHRTQDAAQAALSRPQEKHADLRSRGERVWKSADGLLSQRAADLTCKRSPNTRYRSFALVPSPHPGRPPSDQQLVAVGNVLLKTPSVGQSHLAFDLTKVRAQARPANAMEPHSAAV